ncbi:hypothetical protein HK101_002946 [Irineochytrium annulatum]|nr:hypothetical protein HK101_002946 [Irineochytrium annulatum]
MTQTDTPVVPSPTTPTPTIDTPVEITPLPLATTVKPGKPQKSPRVTIAAFVEPHIDLATVVVPPRTRKPWLPGQTPV